ncbi:hypothetical protein KR222_009973 [Zaprionus bogoriensis]|nr:hypothetical protein KR222_009973 [Zaprionus bogoriensis]
MSEQRKDMWKLLYTLVTRNHDNLPTVYHVIDDILCKHPSLICCTSLPELLCEFQDVFLLWLLNKLAVCLSKCQDERLCLQNVKLQQKLLKSCWCNHPKLYGQLFGAYVDALQQLYDRMSAFDYSYPDRQGSAQVRLFQLPIFQGDISLLKELDEECAFEHIQIQLEHTDMFARCLLLVLQQTHSIGSATHSALFAASLQQALLTLKECNMETKLTSLEYCNTVLQAQTALSWANNPDVPHYAVLTLRATVLMWTLSCRWLEARCMTQRQLEQLAAHTKQLLQALQQQQLPEPQSFELSCQLLQELLKLPVASHWQSQLLQHVAAYQQQQLQQQRALPPHTTQLLLRRWHSLPTQLLPLLAAVAVKQPAARTIILASLTQRLEQLLAKPTLCELPDLLALLRALRQMEQELLQQQQRDLVAASDQALHAALLQQLPHQLELPLPLPLPAPAAGGETNWNQLCLQLLEQSQYGALPEFVECCSLLLQLSCLRLQLKPHTQQQLLSVLQRVRDPLQRLQQLVPLRLETPSSAHTQLQSFYAQQHLALLNASDEAVSRLLCEQLPQLYAAGYLKAAQLQQALPKLKASAGDAHALAAVLRLLLCTQSGAAHVFRVEQGIVLHCVKCEPLPATLPGLYLGCCKPAAAGKPLSCASLPQLAEALLCKPSCGFATHHLELIQLEPSHCLRLLKQSPNLQTVNDASLESIVAAMSAQSSSFMLDFATHVLDCIVRTLQLPLEQQSVPEQRQLLRIILCSAHEGIEEIWLFHWFKMSFYFLLHTHSLVTQEAILMACQLCARHGQQPIMLWNWYKRDALGLIVKLALHAYINGGVHLTRSLQAISLVLGFSCVQEFICKYHRLLTALVLPYCIREPRCCGVFLLISKQLRKPIAELFSMSFLRLYAHVHLSEEPEVAQRCIQLVVSCTESSLQQLMNADVKQTVAELLIYFNRNPSFVMRSFQHLQQLSLSLGAEELSSQVANAQFSTFIADRILGVITYFESCLSEQTFEKRLKEETLHSLGQILRFVGTAHVTQFRFKIIAMLSFVHTLPEPSLQRICLKIWHIFLHVVNIEELGPSLGLIVATLQPLLAYSVEQVNELYEFVILRNAAMLGNYIQDLYFLERQESVAAPIRECIKRHTAQLCLNATGAGVEQAPLLDQLRFLHKQISSECLQVRVYGLEHLAELFSRRRVEMNQMLLHELPMEPLMEQVVNMLMSGCQHDDRSLQLASAKCLGELGAIDASYLPSNYNFAGPQQLPLSVLTDDFTVLALTALCGGYQFQQKTKHVDSFSLAIQETLAVCGIAPKEKKKLQLWQSLPLRMREIMEPFLSSCYTCSQRGSTLKQQPIFGSHYTQNSYELWAFLWGARLVDYVQSSETRHLLSSYKPCIRRDSNMLSTFFPYILLHALLECTDEQRAHIEQEFQAVLQANDELSQQQQQPQTKEQITQLMGQEPLEILAYKQFESKKYGAATKSRNDVPETVATAEDLSRLAGKLCAELLDFLQRWLREWQRLHGLSTAGKPPQSVDSGYRAIYEFLQRMDKLRVARASYNCGEYARALRYLEDYIEASDKPARLLEQFTFLVELYGRLMDADSVEGAVQARSYDMTVTQEILVNRLVERQQDMITCYEQLLSSTEQLQPEHIRAMIDAYLRMDTPKTALLIADGLSQRLSDQYSDQYFGECKAELLWRLGSYDELEQLQRQQEQQRRCKPNWHAQCAQACLALRQPATSRQQFEALLDEMRSSVLEQLRSCSATQQRSYARAYDEVLKLHMLQELQCSQQLMEQLAEQSDGEQELMRSYFADWQSRLQLLQPQLRVLEPIYSFRRNILAELQRRLGERAALQPQLQTQLAQLWLQSAQINRNAGQLQRAHLYLMKAAEYKPLGLFVERAKLLWQKGDQVLAMNYLEEQLAAIRQQCEGNPKQLDAEQRQLYFEGKYLQATYNADSMNLCADAILKYFQEAIAVQRQSERCHVQLAQFLEKMREARSQASSTSSTLQVREQEDLLLQVMVNYAKSLRYGSDHVYQSMPRLISLWLDTAAATGSAELVRKMNDLLCNCSGALPSAMFYTAYSQMLSRLCHPSNEVFAVLRTVIIKLITDYPQQSLWMLLPHFKSAAVNRIKRCKLILTDERLQTPAFQRLLADFNTLTERLMGVTNKEVTLDRTYKLSDLDKRLTQLCGQANFSNILLPFEKYMQPTISISSGQEQSAGAGKLPAGNWFPYQQIYISGFQEKLLVLRSAARPKKLTIRCSDGQDYDVMVKPKDDLRKDARLMEFNGLMKRYLHQDAVARQRRLHIRTYAVLPFNEECGLLEWLPNLNSYRSICLALYQQRGQVMSGRQLQQLAVPQSDPLERKREVFLKQLMPAHPPVFQEWLLQRFTTPHSWYEARNAYIRTVAVMSIVGYILGLGDRHGENILFDERNGDAVHVDFNCLFNQGESFAYPEVVPFRLTHNMITAMGPLGVEGSYRKCCEITLRLLKQETKTLMSMLRPFVFDLGVQSRLTATSSSKSKIGAELTDPKVTNDVQRIAARLQGHVNRQQTNSIPLSTEGQVNFLINEATKVDNLAVMYIGWGAFL